MVKEIKDLEVGSELRSPSSATHYIIVQHLHDAGMVVLAKMSDGSPLYTYKYSTMGAKGWTFNAPLSTVERKAKDLLEALGFKVTR